MINHFKNNPIVSKYIFHCPNGGFRAKREAQKLKAMGVRSGVSDLFLAYPNAFYHGLWLELKSERGKLSDNQNRWLLLMKGVGYACFYSHKLSDSIDIINNYIGDSNGKK